MSTQVAAPESATSAPSVEKAKLVKTLNRFHSVFFILAGMISIETLGQVATYGASTVTWIVILVVIFLLPYGLIVAELGAAYPVEGGPYHWMRQAWGRVVAGVAAVFYWIGNPIWIGGLLSFTAAGAWSAYIHPLVTGSAGDYVFKLAFIWIAVAVAIASLRQGKWIPTLGAIARILALVVFTVAVVLYGLEHGVHGLGHANFSPFNLVVFLGLVPVLLFSFEGFELPSTAAEEMTNPIADVPRAVAGAGVITAVAYIVPIFGIIAVLPATAINGISGFMNAVAKTFTVFGGASHLLTQVAAVAFIFGLLTEGSSWLMGGDRLAAIAVLDGAGPRYFGAFSERLGTPVRLNILSGVGATALLVAAQQFTSGSAAASFTVVLYLATSTGIISYLFILSAGVKLRFSDPGTPRPYRVPGGNVGISVASGLSTALVLLGTWVALFPGLLNQLFGYSYSVPDNFGVSRGRFEAFTLGTFAAILLVALASVAYGGRKQRTLAGAEQSQRSPAGNKVVR